MNRQPINLIGTFVVFAFLFAGCSNPADKKALEDMRAGHAEYVACLQQCDQMAAQYKKQYLDCKAACPMAHPALCDQITNLEKKNKCIEDTAHSDEACMAKCDEEFQKHLAEVDACRNACMAKYGEYFSTGEK